MKYSLSNEQMLLLASVLHYNRVIGIENNLEDIEFEELEGKWKQCEKQLVSEKLLYYTPKQTLSINEAFLIVLDTIMAPDIMFMVQDVQEQKNMEYFYIKKNRAIYMKNDGLCYIEAFESMSQFLSSLSEHMNISCNARLEMKTESVPISKIYEMEIKEEGKLITGVKFIQGIDEVYMSMRTFSDSTNNYLIKYEQDKLSDEVIFIKGSREDIISQLFTFY